MRYRREPLRRWMFTALMFLGAGGTVASIGALPLTAQEVSSDAILTPRNVTYCELSKSPASYNHELIRLTAFITYGFENFHLADPTCSTKGFSVWVMYGGKARSGVVYCCPGEHGEKTRSEPLTVEGIEIRLVNNQTFQKFTDLLATEHDTTVRVTVVGRFFSGKSETVNGSTRWRGAGHMGCCSLFVVQQVESFEPHTRSDLDFSAEAGWYESAGCSEYGSLHYVTHVSIPYSDGAAGEAIAEQRKADSGERAWAFNDPHRVAIESLKSFYPDRIPVLRSVRQASGRQVFRWRNGKNVITVVVIRPYWLSFYAASGSVAWVGTTIKETACY